MTARHPISDLNVLVIGTWNFDIVWNLSIVIWDFMFFFREANYFNLNQLESTLTLTWGYTFGPGHKLSKMLQVIPDKP
jgi:hypothetical protein